MRILITEDAGFIDFHVKRLFVSQCINFQSLNIENLKYACNLVNFNIKKDVINYTFNKKTTTNADEVNSEFLTPKFESNTLLNIELIENRATFDYIEFTNTNVKDSVNYLNTVKSEFAIVIEKRTEKKIACIEEIACLAEMALNYNWIDEESLLDQIKDLKGNYFEYIKKFITKN